MTSKQDEKVAELFASLEKGVQDVYASGKYRKYLDTMAKFHDYSARNCLLIFMQRPEASLVAGFNTWKSDFNRHVKKGEKALTIIGGRQQKITVEEADEKTSEKEKKEIKFTKFFPCSVFDVSQTEGDELPSVADKLTGSVEGFKNLWETLIAISPVPVEFGECGGANGFYRRGEAPFIRVQEGMSEQQTIKTLLHEIAHATLHAGDDAPGQRAREVEAESVAYVVSGHLGIDTSAYSFGYVAGWASGKETKELQESADCIREAAHKLIDDLGSLAGETGEPAAQVA